MGNAKVRVQVAVYFSPENARERRGSFLKLWKQVLAMAAPRRIEFYHCVLIFQSFIEGGGSENFDSFFRVCCLSFAQLVQGIFRECSCSSLTRIGTLGIASADRTLINQHISETVQLTGARAKWDILRFPKCDNQHF